MKTFVVLGTLLISTVASAQSRQCYNLLRPLAGKQSSYPGAYKKIQGTMQTDIYRGINFQKFTASQRFDFQKILAITLWNYWIVLKNNDLQIGALKKKWTVADKEFKLREPASISGVFLDPRAEALNKMHLDATKVFDTRAEVAWRSVLRALELKTTPTDVKSLDPNNSLSKFIDRSTAEDMEKIREFNNYIVEALIVEAPPVLVFNFLTQRMQKNNFDFVTLRSPLCTKGDPVAEKTILSYYQRTITIPKFLATYLMNYTCLEKYGTANAHQNCAIAFRKYLEANDCKPYETPDCKLNQETLKFECSSETYNCFNTYRTKDLDTVRRFDNAPTGFVVAADKIKDRFFCKLTK